MLKAKKTMHNRHNPNPLESHLPYGQCMQESINGALVGWQVVLTVGLVEVAAHLRQSRVWCDTCDRSTIYITAINCTTTPCCITATTLCCITATTPCCITATTLCCITATNPCCITATTLCCTLQ